MAKQDYMYCVQRAAVGGASKYNHLRIELMHSDDIYSGSRTILKAQYQSHRGEDWYGFQLLSEQRNFESLIESGKAAARLSTIWSNMSDDGYGFYQPSPMQLVAALEKFTSGRCVFDDRIQQFVMYDKIKPINWSKWYNTKDKDDDNYHYFSTISFNEGTAKRDILQKWALDGGNISAMGTWVSNGQPVTEVKPDQHNEYITTSIDDLLDVEKGWTWKLTW